MKIGAVFSPASDSAELISALYDTGYFRDIRLSADDGVLSIHIVENPIISDVIFTGLTLYDKDLVIENFRTLGVSKSAVFRPDRLERAALSLKQTYLTSSRYFAKVTPTTSPLPGNRVLVSFDIQENEETKVGEIRIIGAESFPARTLIREMELSETGLFSWLSDDDLYSEQILLADLERIRTYYLDRGFLRAEIVDHQVEFSAADERIALVVTLREGEVYRFDDFELAIRNDELPPEDIRDLVTLTRGEIFSATEVDSIAREIERFYKNKGFAFARAAADFAIDDDAKRVVVTFNVDPGLVYYVDRILIEGNFLTRDEVIRQQLRQSEQEVYSERKIISSIRRLNRLPYFAGVTHEIERVIDKPQKINVIVKVTERDSGAISAGISYSKSEGVGFTGEFTDTNIFGSGNQLDLSFDTSGYAREYRLTFEEPFYTDEGVSRRINFYYETKKDNDQQADYEFDRLHAGWGYGFQVGLDERLYLDIAYEEVKVDDRNRLDSGYVKHVERYGDKTRAALLKASYVHDSRDAALRPTDGQRYRATAQVALPGVEAKYYQLTYDHDWFAKAPFDLFGPSRIHLGGELGYGNHYGDGVYPFYELFYAGGVKSIRGFKFGSISPFNDNGQAIGGRMKVLGTAEYISHLDIFDEQLTDGVLFLDSGFVADNFDIDYTRMSWGTELRWWSPIGLIGLTYARAFRQNELDRKESFQFRFGSTF